MASLVWRLDHHHLTLDDRSVVILDEAGMTDGVGLARLAAHPEAAGAKLIVVGDHSQTRGGRPGWGAHCPCSTSPRRRAPADGEPPAGRPPTSAAPPQHYVTVR